jgi:uncharacterized OB-fold protein
MIATDKLHGKKCKSCGFLQTEPAYGCISCGSMELDPFEFSGEGKIYTYTVVYVGFGHMAEKAPYVLAIVELEEGAKTTTILEDIQDVESAKIGMNVQFKRIDEKIGPIFKPL